MEAIERNQEVDNETLMNCIRNYRSIYDKSSADYRVPLMKRNAWKEVAQKLGIEENEAKTRYNSIRTNFSKYIKKRRSTKSGSGRIGLPEIRGEFEHLRWLFPHIQHRESTSNLTSVNMPYTSSPKMSEMSCDVLDATNMTDEDSDNGKTDDICTKRPHSSQEHDDLDEASTGSAKNVAGIFQEQRADDKESNSHSSKEKSAKRKKSSISGISKQNTWAKSNTSTSDIDKQFYTTMQSLNDALNKPQESPTLDNVESDEDRLFCLSLVGQLKEMDPRIKSMVKLQMMKIFHEAELAKISPQLQFLNQNSFQPSNNFFYTKQVMDLNNQQIIPRNENASHFENSMNNIEKF